MDVGDESMEMVSEPGLTMTVYAAEPASPTADALRLLASWAATVLHGPASTSSTDSTDEAPTVGR